jgi:hypothetical protein
MRARRRYWLTDGTHERELIVAALTLDCPFCSAALGPAVRGMPERPRCECGAAVTRSTEPEMAPPPPGVMAEAFREIRRIVREDIVGQDSAVDALCLLGARHVHLGGGNRTLVIGPSGTGKTSTLVALSRAMSCPSLVWDISTSSEAGWAGVDSNAALAELYEACGRDLDLMQRGVVILDEACKIATRDAQGTTRQHRLGQQKGLLTWLSGGVPVRFPEEADRGRAISVRTDDMLIIAAGAFDGLPADAGPSELVAYGYMPELASRFLMIVPFGRLDPEHLLPIYRAAATKAAMGATAFGYTISVPDSLLMYVASTVATAGEQVTPRAGLGWIQAGVDTALLKLLDVEARPGASYTVRPDDLRIPAALRKAPKAGPHG